MINLHTLSLSRFQLFVAMLLSTLLPAFTTNLSAQSEDDLVYATMQNNQQFVGRIVSRTDDRILLSLDGVNDTLSLSMSMIEIMNSASNKILLKGGRYHKEGTQSYGLGLGMGEANWDPYRLIELITYKNIMKRIGLGGGVGIRLYNDGNGLLSNLNFADLFGYGKLYLTNKRRRLFVDAKVGYAISLNSLDEVRGTSDGEDIIVRTEYSSGFVTQPGIGVEFATKGKLKWAIKINMIYQNTNLRRGPINPSEITNRRTVTNQIQSLDFPSLLLGFYI